MGPPLAWRTSRHQHHHIRRLVEVSQVVTTGGPAGQETSQGPSYDASLQPTSNGATWHQEDLDQSKPKHTRNLLEFQIHNICPLITICILSTVLHPSGDYFYHSVGRVPLTYYFYKFLFRSYMVVVFCQPLKLAYPIYTFFLRSSCITQI
jgi:hypothetical protein